MTELDVEPGIVLAKVQGSRYTPYRVRIRAKVFSEYQWRRAEKAIAARALTLAKLLAGEMPHEIEEVLAACKLTLLPGSYDALRATCTCPDVANPCKHLAAVYYILAERFDEDPFALFTWRGMTREELLEPLRSRRAKATGTRASLGAAKTADAVAAEEPPPCPPCSIASESPARNSRGCASARSPPRPPMRCCDSSAPRRWTSVITTSSSWLVAPMSSSRAPPNGARWRSECKGKRDAAWRQQCSAAGHP